MNARFLTQKIKVPVGCLGAVAPMGIFIYICAKASAIVLRQGAKLSFQTAKRFCHFSKNGAFYIIYKEETKKFRKKYCIF